MNVNECDPKSYLVALLFILHVTFDVCLPIMTVNNKIIKAKNANLQHRKQSKFNC